MKTSKKLIFPRFGDITIEFDSSYFSLSKQCVGWIYGAFEYHLGNRSTLACVIDQYRVKTDKRSGITNDPNRADDPEYIVRLIKKVVTVSVGDGEDCEGVAGIGRENILTNIAMNYITILKKITTTV